jgi:hypothetical protein
VTILRIEKLSADDDDSDDDEEEDEKLSRLSISQGADHHRHRLELSIFQKTKTFSKHFP